MKSLKIKIAEPLWLKEMFKTGRLSKNFETPIQLMLIRSGDIKKYVKCKKISSQASIKHMPKIRKRFGKTTYIFDPNKCEIYEYIE